jgi:hypothetical protein
VGLSTSTVGARATETAPSAPRLGAHRHVAIVLGALAAATTVLFLALYRHIGFDADSVTYIGVARNITAGRGITYPFRAPGARMTDFPPGYPLVLAAGHLAGFHIVGFAQVLQALLLSGAGVLAALLVLDASNSLAFAVLAFVLVAGSAALEPIYAVVYSEPLAIALELGALLLLAKWARRQEQSWLLVAAGVCAALGPVVRWIGVSVIIAGVLLVALFGTGRRVSRALVWGAACMVPAVVAALTNRSHSGSGSGTARDFAWHPVAWSRLHQGFDTVASWWLPHQLPDRWLFGLAATVTLVLAGVVWAARVGHGGVRDGIDAVGPAVVAPAVFVVVYVVTVLAAISLFDAATPLDVRILSPLYAALVPAAVGGLAVWWASKPAHDGARRVAVVAVIVVLALTGVRALTTATGSQDSRLGYASAHWHEAPLMRHLKSLPHGAWIVTNAPEAVYLTTGRAARGLPSKYSSTSLVAQSNYPKKLRTLIASTAAHHGVIAMFSEVKGRPWLPKATELEHQSALRVVARFSDGEVLAPAS